MIITRLLKPLALMFALCAMMSIPAYAQPKPEKTQNAKKEATQKENKKPKKAAFVGRKPASPETVNIALPEGVSLSALLPGPSDINVLWYARPPQKWLEASPIGNGSFGAMVFGGVAKETIQFNHDTIWTHPTFGKEIENENSPLPDVRKYVDEMRNLIFAGKPLEAEKIYDEKISVKGYHFGVYQPMATLRIDFAYPALNEVKDYRHSLDMASASASTEFKIGKTAFKREVFTVEGKNIIVCKITKNGPDKINASFTLERKNAKEIFAEGNNKIVLKGASGQENMPNTEGTRFVAKAAAFAQGGKVSAADGKVSIENADEAIIVISGATDFLSKTPFVRDTADLSKECDALTAEVSLKNVDSIKLKSAQAHAEIYNRLKIDVNKIAASNENSKADSFTRLSLAKDKNDTLLSLQVYNMARYMLICASRGGQPANLQGLWNDLLRPPWSSDYHFNININMNYRFAAQANLGECLQPYFDFLDVVRVNGGKVAREMFGARGFVLGHATSAYATALPLGRAPYAMWETGGTWAVDLIMDYVRFSGDTEFLKRQGFKILEDAALFVMDWSVPNPETGELVVGPGVSPEHFYIMEDKTKAAIDVGCAMDQQLAWQAVSDYIEAAKLLGVENKNTHEAKEYLKKLAPTRLNADGRIQEWSKDYKDFQGGHRHMSQLYAFYPGSQFNQYNSPQMMEAAKKTVERRRTNPGGAGKLGWSRMWVGSLFARFHDGNEALNVLNGMLADQLFPNLLGKYNADVYQIDGNFGYPAIVNEMLVQSHTEYVEILPALPDEWKNGSVSGMLARGGFELAFEWDNGKFARGTIKAKHDTSAKLKYGDKIVPVQMKAGETKPLETLLK